MTVKKNDINEFCFHAGYCGDTGAILEYKGLTLCAIKTNIVTMILYNLSKWRKLFYICNPL